MGLWVPTKRRLLLHPSQLRAQETGPDLRLTTRKGKFPMGSQAGETLIESPKWSESLLSRAGDSDSGDEKNDPSLQRGIDRKLFPSPRTLVPHRTALAL